MRPLTPEEGTDLAGRIVAEIQSRSYWRTDRNRFADWERVASDLAGLRACGWTAGTWLPDHAARYSDNLRRTAVLYSVPLE